MMKMMLMLIMYDGKNWRKLEQDVKWKENIYCKKIFQSLLLFNTVLKGMDEQFSIHCGKIQISMFFCFPPKN